MTSKRYYFVLLGVTVLLMVLIVAGTVGGNMLLEKQSGKLSSLKVESEVLERQEVALVQAKKDIERYAETDKIAKSVVPQDKDQAKTVREIVNIANASGTPVQSITFPSSTLGAPTTAVPAPGGTGAVAPAKPPISQVKPVPGIPGVYVLEIQVTSDGEVPYQNFLRFLESLEKNRRTAHVQVINLDPNPAGTALAFDLTLNAYVKP